ncbi:bridging integrator, putative [Entamoeba invadens IP1]|uniref:Bridging integrator, putative n=2 Tax=Entamoeba invadens TaxID=33085 RepID=A0A0A1U5B2_ENTIV|nr:bridging integrator, putative [Entamoeba invadens IP1]ELP89417.1 bridging integrator, putative [Entamoeba invadens IP1]BAN41925.1 bridging integrator, putative [Entamoeba invadens]|eukprot:XP_004256188.1 bridging integrator, putative [Entamoeba invadens IP1]
MSGIGDAISRKFYQVKTHVGAGQKTVDSDVQYSKTKLGESHKKFKNVLAVIQKLAPTLHATNLMQVEVLTTLGDTIKGEQTSDTLSHVESVISTFQEIDEGVNEYQNRLEQDIIVPLKTYLDQFKTLEKRFETCHSRRVDMDRFHDSVLSISKKPPGKQTGLAESQNKYNVARDLYNYLRDELIADVDKLSSSADDVVSPIVGTLLVSYTDYLNHLNNYWGKASEAATNFKIQALDPTPIITPGEASMVIDANVFSKKNNDVADGSYEPSEFENSTPSSAARTSTSSGKRAPPPPPTRGPKKEQVKCEYDYTAQDQGELSFKEGDLIEVIKKEGDWWLGELNGQQGYFPYNYTTPV